MSEETEPSQSPKEEMDAIFARLTPKQREWLERMPECDWQPYAAAKGLVSRATVWAWLQEPDIQRYRDIERELQSELIGISTVSILSAWQREIECDYRLFFDDRGNVKPPSEWPAEFADCVTEYGTNANGDPYIKFADRRGARDRIAKFLRMTPDQHEVTGKNGAPLPTASPVIVIGGPGEADEPDEADGGG